jgi:hypothetical protein
MQHGRIQFEELLSRTWQVFSANFGPCALVGLVIIAIVIGVQIVSTGMGLAAQASGEPVIVIAFQFFNQLIGFLLQTWVSLGIAYFGLQLARTGRAEISDFFAVGPFYLRGLGMTFLIGLLVVGVFVVCALPALGVLLAQGGPSGVEDNPVPIIVAGVLGVLAAMGLVTWVKLRLYLGVPFLLDRNLGVFESLRNSDTYMSGNKLVVFAVWLVVGLACAVFVVVTCLLGGILVYAIDSILTALAYLMATGQLRTPAKGI